MPRKPIKIEVGKTYHNRGAGTLHRKVLKISRGRPGLLHDELDVEYAQTWPYSRRQRLVRGRMWLSIFKRWVGGEVDDAT